jgi:hypothetical protein
MPRHRQDGTGRFTREAGRQIYFDGKPFIGITREGDTRPVDADDISHMIVAYLNDRPHARFIASKEAHRSAVAHRMRKSDEE